MISGSCITTPEPSGADLSRETALPRSGGLAPGNCWEFPIQKGFLFSLLEFKPREPLCIEYEKPHPSVNFGFILSGHYLNRIQVPGMPRDGLSGQAGTSGITSLPFQEGCLVLPEQPRVRILHIHLTPEAFYHMFHPDRDSLPPGLKPLMDGSVTQPYLFRAGISQIIRTALERVIAGPPPGAPARLFYQGIALDLLTTQIARTRDCPGGLPGLSRDEQDRVIQARNLLIRDLSSPPSLAALARATGLNMNKLQKGFRHLYGTSVFKYLQAFRMQEANRLFHETGMNVSQAAFTVGYTNVSHFSRAYKNHFNILPKKHLAVIRG